jgi:septum formation protein
VTPLLVLASGSPRRARILESLGVPFRVIVTGADETLEAGEDAGAAAERVARAKAASVSGEALPVLAADTLVTCQGRILGKPADAAEAGRMLRLLSGRVHEVVTGVCLAAAGRAVSGVERTAVTFAALSDGDIAWYVATGEPMDKAGAYHVDGRGAAFIDRIEGSPSNVAGLPVRLLLKLAGDLGIDLRSTAMPRRHGGTEI